MPFSPLFSLTVPLASAVILLLMVLVRRLRPYTRFVAPAATGLTLLGVVATSLEPVRTLPLSLWRPSVFFGTFLALQPDGLIWPLAVAVSCAAASAALIQLSRRTQPHFVLIFSALGFLVATLGSLWAENLLTLLFFWGCFDAAWALGMMAVGASARRVALSIGTTLLATAALWAAAMLIQAGGGSLTWQLMKPDGLNRILLLAAGLLRLGLYPLHITLPVGISRSAPMATHLFLGPVLGWALLLRLTAQGGVSLTEPTWLSSLGLTTLAVGGLLAWTRSVASEALLWSALSATGATLAAATFAGDAAAGVLAGGGTAWVLGVTLIALANGFDRSAPWWTIGPLLGGLALVGAPLTLGLMVNSYLIGDAPVAAAQQLMILLGQALLVGGLARRVLRPPLPRGENQPLERVAGAIGLALPSLLLVTGGVIPARLFPSLDGSSLSQLLSAIALPRWGLWLVSVALGGGLFWLRARFRKQIEPASTLLFDLFSLDWALYTFIGGLDRATRFLRELAELIEGAGAVLWALSILLLALLALVGT
jgi:formate hydrogenlyase subunit 3/multisubunit Na+/H+ antiporter MnhD subunit